MTSSTVSGRNALDRRLITHFTSQQESYEDVKFCFVFVSGFFGRKPPPALSLRDNLINPDILFRTQQSLQGRCNLCLMFQLILELVRHVTSSVCHRHTDVRSRAEAASSLHEPVFIYSVMYYFIYFNKMKRKKYSTIQ